MSKYLDSNGLSYFFQQLKTIFAAKKHGVFYGVCSTAAATQAKTLTISGITEYYEGLSVLIKFTNAQTYNGNPTLNINSLGAKSIKKNGTTNLVRYEWVAGEVLNLVYDGTYFVVTDGAYATTTYYGATKLYTGGASTSAAYALTPASLNTTMQEIVTGVAPYSTSATYAVGDRVRYGSLYYKCNTAITTAEAWTAAHWTEMPSLQEQIDNMDVPTSASIDATGLVSFKDADSTTLFTLQLPIYEEWVFDLGGNLHVSQAYTATQSGEILTIQ